MNNKNMPNIDQLVRSKRRTIGLTITQEGALIVRAPLRMPLATIQQAVSGKADWIVKKQAEQLARLSQKRTHAYQAGEAFLFLGERYTLQYRAAISTVQAEGNTLLLPPCPPEQAKKMLAAWYQRQARNVFYDRLTHYAPRMGVTPGTLRLSSARGRWGSCGPTNSINLVWRLVMAPLAVIDYVVIHELAHIKRRDHSKAFWKTVEDTFPPYRQARQYLKEHGAQLEL